MADAPEEKKKEEEEEKKEEPLKAEAVPEAKLEEPK